MGLTRSSTGAGIHAAAARSESLPTVALIGNPNVGKSTLFNALTGLHQHTGNWTGKTVENAEGFTTHRGKRYRLVDLPGTYSLAARSPEEQIACAYVCSGQPDAVVVVCSADAPERTLLLALQLIRRTNRIVVCINLMDEAKKHGVSVDLTMLSERLGVPVVGTNAREKRTVSALMDAVAQCLETPRASATDIAQPVDVAADYAAIAALCRDCIRTEPRRRMLDREASDRFLMKRWVSLPIMALLLLLVFWITLVGANAISEVLSRALFGLLALLQRGAEAIAMPKWLRGPLIDGVLRTVAWIVSVMLPPMAVFFPLFTLLEDAGLLPRIAFQLDRRFAACHACGKQALTICMGFGCNAAGVVGCRIIESKRERLIAILTNAMVPCNGRFPALITVITILLLALGAPYSSGVLPALLLALLVLLAVGVTLGTSWVLGHVLAGDVPSSYVLEIPPFRRPQIGKVLVRSMLDRTLYVLGRAVAVAAPCGLLIWILANVRVDGASLLAICTDALHPFASLFGLDGAILLAFLLGSPANEIVLPIVFMICQGNAVLSEPSGAAALTDALLQAGWTWKTAVCFLLFSVLHWPCATTLWTIRRETRSTPMTLLAAALPTAVGLLLCFCFSAFCNLIGI